MRHSIVLLSTTLILSLVAFSGCRKPVQVVEPVASSFGQEAPPAPVPPQVSEVARNFERVHFEFDSAALDNSSRQALSENAAILARYPDIKIEIQGHCDERGSTGYNLALGQKRADAVYRHLSSAGVTSNRLSTISYGEERPLAKGFAEHAWAQNRRAEFRITWGDAPVLGSAR